MSGLAGRPKRNCSPKCRERAQCIRLMQKSAKTHKCEICNVKFSSGNKVHRFCSSTCRAENGRLLSKTRHHQKMAELYPNGIRSEPCGWCGEIREFDFRLSNKGAYHPKCSKEARSARYRIKTVKRQKVVSRYRISHEQVVREYGPDCHICQSTIDLELPRTHRLGLTVDHVIPLNKGGSDDMHNLRPAHWICNVRKSDKIMETQNA